MNIDGKHVEFVPSFTYLGSIVSADGSIAGLRSNALTFANASVNAAFALAFAFDSPAMAAFALAFAFDSTAFAIAFDSNAFD